MPLSNENTSLPSLATLLEFIQSQPKVSLEPLPGNGFKLTCEAPKKQSAGPFTMVFFVFGILSVLAGTWLLSHPLFNSPGAPFQKAPFLLLMLGTLNVCFAPLAYVIAKLQGPPRDTTLQIASRSLTADRSFAGDHAVNTYGPSEIHILFIESNTLWAAARRGNTHLIPHGDPKTLQAIATLVAIHLWPNENLQCGSSSSLAVNRWMIGPNSVSNITYL